MQVGICQSPATPVKASRDHIALELRLSTSLQFNSGKMIWISNDTICALREAGVIVNVFPALKDGDFHNRRLTFQPNTENV